MRSTIGSLADVCTGLPQTPVIERLQHNFCQLMSILPVVSGIIFEHKPEIQDTIDISLRLSNKDRSLQYFIQQLSDNPKYEVIYTSPEWETICSFLSKLGDCFDDCWLEFDDEHLHKKIPTPSIFINLRQEQVDKNANNLIHILTDMANGNLSSSTLQNFLRLIKSFENRASKGIKIHYIGVMVARGSSSIRCCIKVPLLELEDFVTHYQLPMTSNNLHRATDSKLRDYVNEVVLSIDIAEQISPRIGIEYPIQNPNSASKLYRLLADKSDLNCEWMWENWQRDCPLLSTLLNKEKISLIPFSLPDTNCLRSTYSRRLNHLKLVFNPPSQVELKTYLYLALGWYSLESNQL